MTFLKAEIMEEIIYFEYCFKKVLLLYNYNVRGKAIIIFIWL